MPTKLGLYLMRKRARQTLRWAQSKDILEVGVGRGVFAAEAIRCGCRYMAIDCDAGALARLPEASERWNATVPPISCGDSSRQFGAIVAEAVLEHMPSYSLAKHFILSCKDYIKPGGRLVIRCPDIMLMGPRFYHYPADHQYPTSLPRVCAMIEDAGFVVIKAGHFIEHFTGPLAYVAWMVTWPIPLRMLHLLSGKGYHKSIWSKLGEKQPQCYIVAQKQRQ